MEFLYCWNCRDYKPAKDVIAGECFSCREKTVEEGERISTVTHLCSSLFREPKRKGTTHMNDEEKEHEEHEGHEEGHHAPGPAPAGVTPGPGKEGDPPPDPPPPDEPPGE